MSRVHKIAVAVLLALSLLPLWLYPLFPSQDGPSHLYNTVIFTELWSNPKSFFAHFYELNWRPFPNWAFTLLASIFYPLLPILIVEKVILSVYVVAFVCALFYFLRGINSENTPVGFAGFLFGYNWFLMMGFYNFCLSLPLALVTVGYCIRHRSAIRGRRMILLIVLLLGLYLSHVFSFALVLLLLTLVFGLLGQDRLRALSQVALCSLPAALLFVLHVAAQPKAKQSFFRLAPDWLIATAFNFRIGPWFYKLETVWFVALWVVLVVWLAQGFMRWSRIPREQRIWWLPLGLLLVLNLVAPNNMLGGSALNERFSIYIGLLLLATLSWKVWTLPRAWLMGAFGVLLLAQQVYLHWTIRDWNRRLAPFQHAAAHIESHSRVLPLMFAPNLVEFYANPFLHADCYTLLLTRSVSPTNYEGYRTYFPVKYKVDAPLAGPADWLFPESFLERDMARAYDYVLLWNADPTVLTSPALRGFIEVFREEGVRLLKHR